MKPHHIKIASDVLADKLPGADIQVGQYSTVAAVLIDGDGALVVCVLRDPSRWGARALRVGSAAGEHVADVSIYDAIDRAIASQRAAEARMLADTDETERQQKSGDNNCNTGHGPEGASE